jgi:aspartyl-tRNA synthetase
MYEWSEEEKKIDFSHNPFSMPQGGLEALNSAADPLRRSRRSSTTSSATATRSRRARSGTTSPEIDGAGRSRSPATKDDVEAQFGGMYRAFQFGAPPHGGMAPGVDRIVMLVCGVQNLREITLFPMNQQAQDLLMGAPSEAAMKQLRELGLRVVADKK